MTTASDFKQRLHQHCLNLLGQRIASFRAAMLDAQEAANSEEKSSAGDKYETGRAMSQIQRDLNARQLNGAREELSRMIKTDPLHAHRQAGNGALIETDDSFIYLCAAIGLIEFESRKVAVVSPVSPLARELWGKATGDRFVFAGKTSVVKAVH